MSTAIRAAQEDDVLAITRLNNHYAEQNITLPRTEENVRQTIADWVVAVEWPPSQPNGNQSPTDVEAEACVVGCGSLVALTDELAEVRSLAIAEGQQGKGLGAKIVLELVEMAKERHYRQICALTLTEGFFLKLGFELVDRWSVSPKVWQACIYCPKFHRCDEVAVLMNLDPTLRVETQQPEHDAAAGQYMMPQPAAAQQPAWTKLLKWNSWQPLKLAYQTKNENEEKV